MKSSQDPIYRAPVLRYGPGWSLVKAWPDDLALTIRAPLPTEGLHGCLVRHPTKCPKWLVLRSRAQWYTPEMTWIQVIGHFALSRGFRYVEIDESQLPAICAYAEKKFNEAILAVDPEVIETMHEKRVLEHTQFLETLLAKKTSRIQDLQKDFFLAESPEIQDELDRLQKDASLLKLDLKKFQKRTSRV